MRTSATLFRLVFLHRSRAGSAKTMDSAIDGAHVVRTRLLVCGQYAPCRTPKHHRLPTGQKGIAAVEFAVVAIVFFLLFFGIVELARAMYICNTLQEVTRRAAALAVNTDFSDSAGMQHIREVAVFRNSPGVLPFGDPITDQYVKIDYLQIPAGSTVPVSMTGALPASPQQNSVNCLKNINAADCIRLVRVRICLPGGGGDACNPVPYKTLVSLIPFSFSLPHATTIAKIETMGIPAGTP